MSTNNPHASLPPEGATAGLGRPGASLAVPRVGRAPATPTSGLRLRVLMACSAAGGGYTPEQIIERWGDGGMSAARYLVGGGFLAHDAVHDRYLRTPAGDAVCPSRRDLARREAA